MNTNNDKNEVNRIMTVVVQEQDVETAINALIQTGASVTHLASTGGFLGRRNATLIIGLNQQKLELAVGALTKSCRRRVEYVATPLEGSPLPFPSPTPITVGGATIFTLEVERYIEL